MITETLEGFELSPQQKHLWSLQQRGGKGVYRSYCMIAMNGDLSPEPVAKALQWVVKRHEVLRTGFQLLPGMSRPLQVISPEVRFDYVWRDLQILPEAEQGAQRRVLQEGAVEAADGKEKQILCVTHLTFGPGRHLVALELPAMYADMASLFFLAVQIRAAYLHYKGGAPPPDPPVQYADIADMLNECLTAEEFDIGRQFWRSRDWGSRVQPDAAFESPSANFCPRMVQIPIADRLAVMVEEFSARSGVSCEGLLLTAWGVLRCRVEAVEEVLISLGCDGRTHDLLLEAIGALSRYVPFLFRLRPGSSFEELARVVDSLRAEVREEQHYFDPGAFGVGRGAAGIVDGACFEYVRLPGGCEAGEHAMAIGSLVSVSNCFLTKLTAIQGGYGLRLQVEYDASTISETDALRLGEAFTSLLESALRNPGWRSERLEILNPEAKREILALSCGPEAQIEPPFVHEAFEQQVKRRPDAVAVVSEGRCLSYDELNRRTNQLGQYLRRLGVGPETRVGLYLERSLEMVIGLLGVLKAGGAYLPLDRSYPVKRLAFMLDDAKVDVMLTQESLAATLDSGQAQIVCLDTDWRRIAQEEVSRPDSGVTAQNLAYVIYTSGSTGQPKGVMIPHRAVCNHMHWMQEAFPLSPQDLMLQKTPFGFDAAATEFFLPLMAGGRLVMARPGGHRDPDYLARVICEEGVTILQVVPSLLRELVASQKRLIASGPLRRIFSGGERLTVELATECLRGGTVELCNLYGPTEAAIDASYWEAPRGEDLKRAPIGGPIANSRVYVLDREMQLAPRGVSGELYIGGEAVGRGYHQRPEMTGERFVPNPYEERGGRLYRTGDLGRLTGTGEIEYLGRIDQQVKVRGNRIELGEIEAALEQHERVKQSVVIAREEEAGDQRLVAYVVMAGEKAVSVEEMRRHLGERLPEYMAPGVYVELKELPVLPNGKLDRKALPAPAASGEAGQSEGPRTPVEEIVAGILAEVLGLEVVRVAEDFFALGGHSLLATQVTSRIREAFGVEVALQALFENPTVTGLGETIEQERRANRELDEPPIVPVSRNGELPLSYAQQRLWFIHQLEPGSAAYNIPMVVRIDQAVAILTLRQSLGEIMRRHEALRTRFESRSGRPVQVVVEPTEIELPIWDLSDLGDGDRESQMREIAWREALRPFELGRGPVFRTALMRLGPQDNALSVNMHHVVSDEWSTGLLEKELTALYAGFSEGRSAILPEIALQYADFAVWQRAWLQGQVLDTQLDYWRRQLAGRPVMELPTDRPRTATTGDRGAMLPFRISAELMRELRALSRRERVTLFMTLLAGFQLALRRYTGQQEIVVGTDVANRNRLETENLIGFFVNQLVLRMSISESQSLRELLRQVREMTLGAYAHQDLPFEKLVEELSPERDWKSSPLFQVKFVLGQPSRQSEGFPSLEVGELPMNITIAKFDLLFNLFETSDGLLGYITFRSDLFTKGSVNWLLSIYDAVLGQFGQPESLDQSVQTLMATVEAQLRSKTRPEIGLSPFPSLSVRTRLR